MPAPESDAVGYNALVEGKRVSWVELFFDLVFVFAVTRISTLLTEDHSWAGVARALIVFIPVYWAWVGTAIHANVHDMTGAGSQLAILAVAMFGLFMALSVTQAYGERGWLFALAYWLARLVWGARLLAGRVLTVNPVSLSMVFTGPLLLVGSAFDGGTREVIWLCAAVVELSSLTLLRRRLEGMHFDAGHLTERFGLFVLIALGESVVAIGGPAASSERLGPAVLTAVSVAFVLTCGLWWVYFYFANEAMRHALSTAQVQLQVTRHVLSYAHVLFIASIIAVAVGMHEAIAEPEHSMNAGVVGLLFGGCALYLAGFGYTRWMMFRLISTTRLVAAAVVVLLIPVAVHISALASLSIVTIVLVGLNCVELWRVRTARRVPTST